MINWRALENGDRVKYSNNEFGVKYAYDAIVVGVYQDHATAICDGMSLWIDDDTKHLFYKGGMK